MNRRAFIRAAAGAAAIGGLYAPLAGCAGEDAESMETMSDEMADEPRMLSAIGVQLYTVRSLMEENVEQTLQSVAEIGYDEVEFAGYFDHSPEDIRGLLDEFGLQAPAAHVGLQALRDDLDGVIQTASTIGHQYIICPYLSEEERGSIDAYREHAAFFNEVGGQCQEAGIQFGYHNHDFEFESMDGTLPFDVLLDETDPELVCMELDLFWIRHAGHDALAYIDAYPGRFELCHVKDRTADGDMVAVGEGAIDFAAIFAQAEQAGLQHYIVEHDRPEDPLASIRRSYQYLSQLQI